MSKRVTSYQSNQSRQKQELLMGLRKSEISQIERLNMLEKAEKIKSIKKQLVEANDYRLAQLLSNKEKLESLKFNGIASDTNEINRISMVIDNLEAQESKFDERIHNLSLNLSERAAIIEELLKSKYGREVLLLPPAPKGRGKKKKKTCKRKKPKKRKRKTKK